MKTAPQSLHETPEKEKARLYQHNELNKRMTVEIDRRMEIADL